MEAILDFFGFWALLLEIDAEKVYPSSEKKKQLVDFSAFLLFNQRLTWKKVSFWPEK